MVIDASHALLRGDTEKAEQLATAAFELGAASGQPDAAGYHNAQIARTRLQQGRTGELGERFLLALEKVIPSMPSYRAGLAVTLLESGDENRARQLVDQAAAESFSLPEDFAWLDGMVGYATVVIELHLPAAAEQLSELLAPYRDQVPENQGHPQPPVAMFLGGLASVLQRFNEADAYFQEAAELNRRGQMKFAQAHTNMLWGRMLRTRDEPCDADRARSLLEHARDIAATHGYATIERQARAELSTLTE
jgi:hypothetical protein